MRVKIGDTVYDTEALPICVEVTEEEKEVVAQMPEGHNRLALYPNNVAKEQIEAWMQDFGDEESEEG